MANPSDLVRSHPELSPIAPRFSVIDRQPVRPAAILLAIFTATGALALIGAGVAHSRGGHVRDSGVNTVRSPSAANGSASTPDDEEKDDPSQVDTIVLGDAADAPEPARRSNHVSSVHATVLVHLPRFGAQTGLIPDSPAGHLLYGWLAAFNQASSPAMELVLPSLSPASIAAQMKLRQQTGGFNLLSAREVGPGVLVFRLRDQTPEANEVLGTLQVLPGSSPAVIASFSVRAVTPPDGSAASTAASQ